MLALAVPRCGPHDRRVQAFSDPLCEQLVGDAGGLEDLIKRLVQLVASTNRSDPPFETQTRCNPRPVRLFALECPFSLLSMN